MPPDESIKDPWFFASCADADAGKNTPAAARPTSVIRIAEIMIIDPPVYAMARDPPERRLTLTWSLPAATNITTLWARQIMQES
jgi:hypothetical protein